MRSSIWLSAVSALGILVGCGSSEQTETEPTSTTPEPSATVTPSANPSTPNPVTPGSPSVTPPAPNPTPNPPITPTPTSGPDETSEPVASTELTNGDSSTASPSSPTSDEGSAGTSSEAPDTGGACEADACPFEGGLDNGCSKRFALGVNYAWHDFGADFGGLAQWNMGGITANQAIVKSELAEMRSNGVSVVRWWMFPDFRGDGVQFDGQDNPTGLSATALLDIQTALALAAENDIYVVFTIFSFDNFRPTRTDSEVLVRGMTPLVNDAARRAKLIDNIVKPVAQAAAGAPHAERLLGWDVINEPEWAVSATGTNDQDFTPNEELDAVSLADMKALINESLAALGTEAPGTLRSVGWAAAKWVWAFNDVTNVEFHQPHIYGWVDQYWPYTQTPTQLGYTGKPTVMGEFYMLAMPFSDGDDNASFSTIVSSWFDNGYAGAWAWAYSDQTAGPGNLPLVKAVADSKGCEATF